MGSENMKKSDPTGSGVTIEYLAFPSETSRLEVWATVGTSAFDGVFFRRVLPDKQNVGAAVLNLINGQGRIFLADKLHIIGETSA